MASQTAGDRLTHRPALEVTEDAGLLGHGEMRPLHDLRVAARAAQLLALAQLSQVLRVVEVYDDLGVGGSREVYRSLHATQRVAPRPETSGVFDLSPRLGSILASHILHDLIGRLELAHRLGFDPRGIVALDARYLVVAGRSPGVVVRLHQVAVGAERRLSRVLDEPYRPDRHQDHSEHPDLDQDLERARKPLRESQLHRHQRTTVAARAT